MNAPLRTCHLLLTALLASAPAFTSDDARCHVGAYRLDDGAIVAISPVSEPAQLRWRRVDGRTGRLTRAADGAWPSTLGWTDRSPRVEVGFGACDARSITLEGHGGKDRKRQLSGKSV